MDRSAAGIDTRTRARRVATRRGHRLRDRPRRGEAAASDRVHWRGMSRTSRSAVRVEKATPAAVTPRVHPLLLGVLAWLVPGAGHFLQGYHRKALIFFGVLTAMFGIGLAFGGRLFP